MFYALVRFFMHKSLKLVIISHRRFHRSLSAVAPCFFLCRSLVISASLMSSSNQLELRRFLIYHRIFRINLISTCWTLILGLVYKNAMILYTFAIASCVKFQSLSLFCLRLHSFLPALSPLYFVC